MHPNVVCLPTCAPSPGCLPEFLACHLIAHRAPSPPLAHSRLRVCTPPRPQSLPELPTSFLPSDALTCLFPGRRHHRRLRPAPHQPHLPALLRRSLCTCPVSCPTERHASAVPLPAAALPPKPCDERPGPAGQPPNPDPPNETDASACWPPLFPPRFFFHWSLCTFSCLARLQDAAAPPPMPARKPCAHDCP